MSSVFLINHLDFARSFEGCPEKATPETIAAWLKSNWLKKRGGGSWNYVPAMDVLVLAFMGGITLQESLQYCRKYWHPRGRLENELVVQSFWRFAQENRSRVYKRSFLAAPIGRWQGRNIFLGIRAPLIRVTGDELLAVMPVFRKAFVPNVAETNLSMTAVREFCLREGYPDINIELMRAVGIDGSLERRLVVERGSERQMYSSEDFDTFAAKFAGAVALLADAGLGLQQPNFKGYRVWDPDQTRF